MPVLKFLATLAFLLIGSAHTSAALAESPTPEPDLELGLELGPAIGTQIPHQLDVDGQPGFAALTGEKGMVLFFVRSIDWCPFCKNQVIDVSARATEFADRDLSVVYLSYDAPAKQAAFQAQRNIQGQFVSDPRSEIINAFGLLNTSYGEDSFAYGTPHPSVFILDSSGQIKAKLYEEDYVTNSKSYRNRPAVDIILEKADAALAP